nr:ATP-binding cassette domain-containing protein [Actinomyces sp.]
MRGKPYLKVLSTRGPRPTGANRSSSAPALATPASSRDNWLSFTLTAVAGLAQTWALICLGRALGSLVTPTSLAAAPATPDRGSMLVQAAVCVVVAAGAHWAAQAVARASAARLEAAIRSRALRHLLHLGPVRATQERTGSTVSLLTDGAERVALYRQTFLAPTVAAALGPALSLLVLGVSVDRLTALVLAVATVLTPALIVGSHSRLRTSSSRSRRARTRLAAEYLDAIQGLPTLTLARAARRRSQELRRQGETNRRAVMQVLAGNQLVILITDALFSLFLVTAATGLSLARLGSGAITVGDALAIVLVAYMLLEPLDHVGAFFYVGMSGLANQRALGALLARERPGCDDDAASGSHLTAAPGSGTTTLTTPGPASSAPCATISLSGLEVAWQVQGDPVLSGVSLEVDTGESLAVVGPSGAGKSTLMSVLAGDLLPTAGTATIKGVTLTPATQDLVRAASARVAQTTWLFTGTIADNLRLAAPEAQAGQMWQALAAAHLDEEVRRMPLGLDTPVGEGGTGLSGGQAQRLSLARAVLSGRDLLLLDEPTSQVDLASEAAIQEAIEQVARTRTVVTVSHRAGALVGADRVVRVAESGVTEVSAPAKDTTWLRPAQRQEPVR